MESMEIQAPRSNVGRINAMRNKKIFLWTILVLVLLGTLFFLLWWFIWRKKHKGPTPGPKPKPGPPPPCKPSPSCGPGSSPITPSSLLSLPPSTSLFQMGMTIIRIYNNTAPNSTATNTLYFRSNNRGKVQQSLAQGGFYELSLTNSTDEIDTGTIWFNPSNSTGPYATQFEITFNKNINGLLSVDISNVVGVSYGISANYFQKTGQH